MMRARRSRVLVIAACALLGPGSAYGADLTATKTATVLSDPLGNAAPKSLPGAVVEYKVLFTNPVGNTGKTVDTMRIDDVLPASVVLRVANLASGTGPIEFADGGLVGLLASGLTCSFASLSSTTDCFDFYDGSSWSYAPTPDAQGYDVRVRAIRIKPGANFRVLGSFQIRYRVMIR
ncbi:hypothetical protein [Sphingomonas sp. UYP23]